MARGVYFCLFAGIRVSRSLLFDGCDVELVKEKENYYVVLPVCQKSALLYARLLLLMLDNEEYETAGFETFSPHFPWGVVPESGRMLTGFRKLG